MDSGTYDVTFKFAETYFSSGGNRIFNVKLEGTQYITDLDVCAEVGQDAAYDETDTVTVSDGELTINFTITENNPIVSAILVESQGGAGSSANPGDLEQDAQVVKIPDEFDLHQNYPNPFNPETTIQYDLPQAEHVILKIYDLLGREVTTLLDREMEAGYHKVTWSARDNYSNPVSTGIYIVRVVAGDFIAVKKMLLMK